MKNYYRLPKELLDVLKVKFQDVPLRSGLDGRCLTRPVVLIYYYDRDYPEVYSISWLRHCLRNISPVFDGIDYSIIRAYY